MNDDESIYFLVSRNQIHPFKIEHFCHWFKKVKDQGTIFMSFVTADLIRLLDRLTETDYSFGQNCFQCTTMEVPYRSCIQRLDKFSFFLGPSIRAQKMKSLTNFGPLKLQLPWKN